MLASQDDFDVSITGRGGHAASPHTTVDPVVIAAQVIIGLQSLVSRTVDPTESFVVSVTKMKGSEGYNVIPDRAELSGTVRVLSPSLRDLAERSIERIARGISAAHGAELDFRYRGPFRSRSTKHRLRGPSWLRQAVPGTRSTSRLNP